MEMEKRMPLVPWIEGVGEEQRAVGKMRVLEGRKMVMRNLTS